MTNHDTRSARPTLCAHADDEREAHWLEPGVTCIEQREAKRRADAVARRWKVQECTRCQADLGAPGSDAYTLTTRHYEPMPDGPDWEAIGDWAEGPALGGTLCPACLSDLQSWLITGLTSGRRRLDDNDQ